MWLFGKKHLEAVYLRRFLFFFSSAYVVIKRCSFSHFRKSKNASSEDIQKRARQYRIVTSVSRETHKQTIPTAVESKLFLYNELKNFEFKNLNSYSNLEKTAFLLSTNYMHLKKACKFHSKKIIAPFAHLTFTKLKQLIKQNVHH